jgi:hypothetical protein
METYVKIKKAIEKIKASDLKKGGFNSYSEYKYYTPEQVDKLVYDACQELNLFNHFDLVRDEQGEKGVLKVIDLDSNTEAVFIMATGIPEIKATNAAQQIGGCMTYTKRYMLMNVYDIVDNNLDFDTTKNTQEREAEPAKPWLNKTSKDGKVLATYIKVVKAAKEKGMDVQALKQHYNISKAVQTELKEDLKLNNYDKLEDEFNLG